MKVDGIIFDLDGTLIASRDGIVASVQKVIPEATAATVPIGPKLPDIIRALRPHASETQVADLVAGFRAHYDEEGYQHTVLFAGVAEVLMTLRSRQKRLWIATYKRVDPTEKILTMLGIRSFFHDVFCVDSREGLSKTQMVALIKQQSAVQQSTTKNLVMVGDSIDDEEAAVANGLPFWFAEFGYGKANSDVVLRNFDDVLLHTEDRV